MKQLLIIAGIFVTSMVNGQDCTLGEHSTNKSDVWLSCQTSTNPNSVRGNTHWIKYDLGYLYKLETSHLWNYNVANETDNGVRNLIIDVSTNGIDWEEVSVFELEEASNSTDYAGTEGPNFEGIEARYVLFTLQDSWGGDCVGLSEIRIDISEATTSILEPISLADLTIFPNPSFDIINIKSLSPYEEFIIQDAFGHEVGRFEKSDYIDISYLPDGMYVLQGIAKDQSRQTQKFIKQTL